MKKYYIATEEMKYLEYVKRMDRGEKNTYRELPDVKLEDMLSIFKASDEILKKYNDSLYDYLYDVGPVTYWSDDDTDVFAVNTIEGTSKKNANFDVAVWLDPVYKMQVIGLHMHSFTDTAHDVFGEDTYICTPFRIIREAILMSGVENRQAILYSLVRSIARITTKCFEGEKYEEAVKRYDGRRL